MTEAQERFLRAIADRVPPASIAELHLFPAIRQGGHETGIAVIAAEPAAAVAIEGSVTGSSLSSETAHPQAASEDDSPYADAVQGELEMTELNDGGASEASAAVVVDETPHRLIVLSASYRLTLKGADRGKWDVEVLAQADAPLVTVDAVVRGVQRRAGDAGDPERLTGEALRALLDEWSCTATTR